ncbi:aminotransferase-like domain-containing protein [Pedobacter hartonius]|uniref:hypothetical protein n=1 Tax=Pedobacter hartonius TaxID=425514 RepID=UPI000B826D79|nr:hypothetical protein [Pedobacter hartonius]
MKKPTKYLTRILNNELTGRDPSPRHIAAIIAGMVVKHQLKPGVQLPTQRQMEIGLNVSKSVIRQTWHLLRQHYMIIDTKKSEGTYIIPELSRALEKRTRWLISQLKVPNYQAMLDREYIPGFDTSFNREVSKALSRSATLPFSSQRLKVIPDLITELMRVMSRKMNYPFTGEELYYTGGYVELISHICEAFSSARSIVAMIEPASGIVWNAITRAKRKVEILGADGGAELMDRLELLCHSRPVAIVYLGAAPYPLLTEKSQAVWDRLSELQQQYRFKILLDDRYPGLVPCPNLFERIQPGSNRSVILVTVVSLHSQLSGVNVVAAYKEDISRIKKMYKTRLQQVDPSIGYGLLELLKKGQLNQHERDAYIAIRSMVSAAKKLLQASGLFKTEFIRNQQGYFFYLELLDGSFHRNVYKKFAKIDLFVMDPSAYRCGPPFQNGILISLAYYTLESTMVKDLNKLIVNIKNMKK